MRPIIQLLCVSILVSACASSPPAAEDFVCKDCRETIVNDFGGHLTVWGPDVIAFDHLEPVKKNIFLECEFKVLSFRRDLDPAVFAEDVQLTRSAQNQCADKFIALAKRVGYQIAPAKSVAAEVWRLRFEERLVFPEKMGAAGLYKPADKTTTWATLSRFRAKEIEPFSHKLVEAQSIYKDGYQASGKVSLKSSSEKEYSHFEILSKALLIQARSIQD